ncbi:hypothetical protein LX36DRAFT_556747, partial [Colletotrichum falcatum]
RLVVVIACVIFIGWLMFLDNSIAIPFITDEFHSLPDIGWYGSAYQVANAAFQPLTGKIYRHFSTKVRGGGRRKLTCSTRTVSGRSSAGPPPLSMALILGRVVAGVGSAGIMSGLVGSVPLEKRP